MKLDLTRELTVFVLSTTEWTIGECLARLDAQDSAFRLKRIHMVTPMWRAFQAMLDRCETPYLAQVDADMLLRPDAIRRLHHAIAAAPDDVAFVSAWLWDADVGRSIHGVKAYDHQKCARYPYRESTSCEVDQFQRMAEDGLRWAAHDDRESVPEAECLGVHVALQGNESAFRRWKRLVQKMRVADQVGWIAPHLSAQMDKVSASPTDEVQRWKLLGMIAGMSGPRPTPTEYDASKPDQDFRRLSAFFGEEAKGPKELVLYLTDRCNFRCEFDGVPCMRETEDQPGAGVPHNGDLEPWRLREVLDKWPTIRGSCIAGFGEPLMHPKLGELMDLLAERAVYIGLITNGSLLLSKRAVLEPRVAAIGYLSVSLNAVDAGGHEEMSKTKTWERVLEGIRVYARDFPSLNLGVSFVVGKPGLDEIPHAIQLANELGVKFCHFLTPLPHAGLDLQFKSTVLRTSDADALEKIETFKRLPGAEIVQVWPTPISADIDGQPLACRSPFDSLGVDGKGFVSECRRVDPPSEARGGIYWPGVWRGPTFQRSIFELTGDRDLPPKCRGCLGNVRG